MRLSRLFLFAAGLLTLSLSSSAETLTLKPGSAAVFVLKPARAASSALDTTPPTTTAGPSVSGTTDIGTTLSATIDEKGTGYYLVKLAGESEPDAATMQTSGLSFAMSANVAATQVVTGLTGNTSYKIYFIAKDANNNVQAIVKSVSFSTLSDTTPPTTTDASVASTTDTATTLAATINEAGTGYYVVQTSGLAPTVAQIMAGQNSSGTAALKSGNSAMTANAAANMNITGLTGSTSYTIYFVAKDAANNVQSQGAVRSVAFTTNADTTPPNTVAGPSVSDTAATSTKLSVTIDENGTGYYLVQASASAAPTVATVMASGTAFSMSAFAAASQTLSGLTASTSYKIYFVAKDAAAPTNNVQAAVQSVEVTTSANPCFTATNSAHVSAGRASYSYVSFAWRYIANGSSNDMGLSGFSTTKLRQTGTNYYIIDATCP